MTAETTASACECTLESLSPLKSTTKTIHYHRVWFEIDTTDRWYSIVREANLLYGSGNWKGQPRTKKKLENNRWQKKLISVWFDVPDEKFGTWIGIKHAITVAQQK